HSFDFSQDRLNPLPEGEEITLPFKGRDRVGMGFSGETRHIDRRLRIIHEIALAAGPEGMVGGQQLDIENEGKNIDVKALEELHRRKTGALILAAVRSGGIAGGAAETQLSALTDYGMKIGLAFQIADDILDLEGDVEYIGKSTGKDVKQNKNTYPALLGSTESKIVARNLVDEALEAIESFDEKAVPLRMIAEYIVDRKS
ncbi:MAG: polyprenyl synthetase family protein, partial [Nitrospirota bacterium]